jgi:ankyrin repeat protein
MRELSFVIRRKTLVLVLLVPACLLLASALRDDQLTPLTWAPDPGETARIRTLTTSGSAPDADSHGWPPLVQAVRGGHLEAIRTLVRKGADPDLLDNGMTGWTPQTHATHEGQLPGLRA